MNDENGTYLLNPAKYMKFCKAVKYAIEICQPMNAEYKILPLDASKRDGVILIRTGAMAFRQNRIQALRNLFDDVDECTINNIHSSTIIELIVRNLFVKIEGSYNEQ